MLRIVLVSMTSLAIAIFSSAGPAHAAPPTEVITAVAVGADGQPINGYQEMRPQGSSGPQVVAVSDCSTPSPSAVANNIYYCTPSAAGAGTCWPSQPGTLLCMDNPWDKRLHRVTYGGQLPPVQSPPAPEPFALILDDGTRCSLRNGGAWGGRDDGYVGAYWCEGSANLRVLCLNQDDGTCIDRSASVWTVKVGKLGAPDAHLPPPQTRSVKTAWLAGD